MIRSIVQFTIEIDIEQLSGEPRAEIARILRYWGGAIPQMELTSGLEQELMDSGYSPVGHLRVTD
jgi:hypothetical protein